MLIVRVVAGGRSSNSKEGYFKFLFAAPTLFVMGYIYSVNDPVPKQPLSLMGQFAVYAFYIHLQKPLYNV